MQDTATAATATATTATATATNATATAAAAAVVKVIAKALAPKKLLPKRKPPRASTVIKSRTFYSEEEETKKVEYKAPEAKEEDAAVVRTLAATEAQLNSCLARYSQPNPYPSKRDQDGQQYYRAWHNKQIWGYPCEEHLMVLVEFHTPKDDGVNKQPRAPVYMTVDDVKKHTADKNTVWKEVPTALKFGVHLLFVQDEKLCAMRVMAEHRGGIVARAEAAATGKTTINSFYHSSLGYGAEARLVRDS
jgi:hypothetical protein